MTEKMPDEIYVIPDPSKGSKKEPPFTNFIGRSEDSFVEGKFNAKYIRADLRPENGVDAVKVLEDYLEEYSANNCDREDDTNAAIPRNEFVGQALETIEDCIALLKKKKATLAAPAVKAPRKEEINEEYESFWKEHVEVDGVLNIDRVKAELFDFSWVMEQVPKVYCHVTGSLLSKIMYEASTVISAADDFQEREREEILKEEKEHWLDEAALQPAWRPIEGAPKDGTRFDIWDKVNQRRYCDCVYDAESESWYDPQGFIRFPSHYMPLPAAPTGGK